MEQSEIVSFLQYWGESIWTYVVLYSQVFTLREWLLLAIVVIVLTLYYLFRGKIVSTKIFAFDGPSGPVEVSSHAVSDLVGRACATITDIGKVNSTLRDRKSLLRIDVQFKMMPSSKLDEVIAELSEKVENSIRETLNVKKKIRIYPKLKGFIGKAAAQPPAEYVPPMPDPSASAIVPAVPFSDLSATAESDEADEEEEDKPKLPDSRKDDELSWDEAKA